MDLLGYTWLRDYYCAIIKVNTHRYNWEERAIEEIVKAEIQIKYDDVQSFQKNQNIIGAYDHQLDKIILNFSEAKNIRSFKSDFLDDDSTGNWIDFNVEYLEARCSCRWYL